MENLSIKEGKTIAIVSYITIIGTLIAFVMNNNKRNSFASFHIRQALGIYLLFFVIQLLTRFGVVGWLDDILYFLALLLLIIGIVGAIQVKKKECLSLEINFKNGLKILDRPYGKLFPRILG